MENVKPFKQNRWAGLAQAQLPSSLFSEGTVRLSPAALTVYAVLVYLHQARMRALDPVDRLMAMFASVPVSVKRLMHYTGLSINTITNATKELESCDLVHIEHNRKNTDPCEDSSDSQHDNEKEASGPTRRKSKNRDNTTTRASRYYLMNPGPPTTIPSLSQELRRKPLEVRRQINVFPANNIKYFTFPSCIIANPDEKASLAQMTGSETRLYFALCWLSSAQYRREGNVLDTDTTELRRLSGLKSPKTMAKALDGLECDRRLIQTWPSDFVHRNGEGKPIRLELCDPFTGNPMVRDDNPKNQPAHYRLKGRRKRPTLHLLEPAEIESVICKADSARGGFAIHLADGEMMLKCPFHLDDTPSLSVNCRKNGCWYCHGCRSKGNIYELLAQLGGTTVSEVMVSLAASAGIEIEYQDPDRGAIIYRYMTEDGKKVLKHVVTRVKDGVKVITQRRPGPPGYGYICNADGVRPSLYHVELLQGASTVCIVEGEKDADTVTNLQLGRPYSVVVGVTSGGAASWKPEFAKYLKGKNVVLMPDDDEAGEQYAVAVRASLEAEDIEYREVRFGDVGCKDVSDFLLEHPVRELVQRIGSRLVPLSDWHESSTALGPFTI